MTTATKDAEVSFTTAKEKADTRVFKAAITIAMLVTFVYGLYLVYQVHSARQELAQTALVAQWLKVGVARACLHEVSPTSLAPETLIAIGQFTPLAGGVLSKEDFNEARHREAELTEYQKQLNPRVQIVVWGGADYYATQLPVSSDVADAIAGDHARWPSWIVEDNMARGQHAVIVLLDKVD